MKRAGWIKRHKPMAKRNAKRRAKNSLRCYGDSDRREWLLAHVCLVCFRGPVVQAHTSHPSAGMGHKGDACANVPLCDPHHRESGLGVQTFERKYAVELGGKTLAECAQHFDAAYRAFLGAQGAS